MVQRNKALELIGPASSLAASGDAVPEERKILLERGTSVELRPGLILRGVYCDHGDQSPDAIGVVLELGTATIYFTGDTCYRPDLRKLTGVFETDIIIVPINPSFGNPGPDGAAKLVKLFEAKTALPCHYWLFKEHGGDPAAFEEECAKTAPLICKILAIGEEMSF